jgi:hypothetical protein
MADQHRAAVQSLFEDDRGRVWVTGLRGVAMSQELRDASRSM